MLRSARPVLLHVALATGALLLACGAGANAATPEHALEAYSRSIQRGHLAEAYALLSSEGKKTISFSEFKRMIEEDPEQAQELVRAFDRPRAGPARVTAEVSGTDGEPLLLVYENGAWRVDGSAIDLYSQVTPESAARAFVRAVQNKRYDLLLRFVPDSQREGLTLASLRAAWEGEQKQDMARLIEVLKAALPTARFELVGERATLALGAGGTMELLREHGAWKVEELK
jgi:hypothetical protein